MSEANKKQLQTLASPAIAATPVLTNFSLRSKLVRTKAFHAFFWSISSFVFLKASLKIEKNIFK